MTLNVFQWVGNGIGNGTYSGDLTFTAGNGNSGSFTADWWRARWDCGAPRLLVGIYGERGHFDSG